MIRYTGFAFIQKAWMLCWILFPNISPAQEYQWTHLSSVQGDLEVPNSGNQQTASCVFDVDRDGINDFFITERTNAPAVVWYRKVDSGWERHIVEPEAMLIEAGSAYEDIDGDGDLDVVFGGEARSNQVWWWENPYPDYDPEKRWRRHIIKKSGGTKHHDQLFGDFDGDGENELVFWNQGSQTLFIAEKPVDPINTEEWDLQVVYKYYTDSQPEQLGQEGYPGWKGIHEHEGLAKADIDGDGTDDIVGGGRWFKYNDGEWQENLIDPAYTFTRSAGGQLVKGGRPEVLLVVGDGVAPLMLYEYRDGTWFGKELVPELDNGHTLDIVDFNEDGNLDIFLGEMRFGEGNPDSKLWILMGDGKGNFEREGVAIGYGIHEGKIADLDGDGDLDILGKPYTWEAPRLDIWINEGLK